MFLTVSAREKHLAALADRLATLEGQVAYLLDHTANERIVPNRSDAWRIATLERDMNEVKSWLVARA